MSLRMFDSAEIVFWASGLLVVYAYAGYPLLVHLAAKAFGRIPLPPSDSDADLPSVTLLIVVNNEAAIIGQRLENAVAIDYPRHRFSIVVASDGCTDNTDDIVRSFANRGVVLDSLSERRGKAATLNRVIPTLTSDVLVLSDGNTFTEPDSVRKLARWFADPAVGIVCGKLVLIDRATGHNVDGLYWRIETALKSQEALLGGLSGINGAIYGLRHRWFVPLPPNTIVDDLVMPQMMRITHHCRLLFDPEAKAFEETAPTLRDEFNRRARIGTGGFQALTHLWPLLDPRRGWIAFTFASHKVLRWICPLLLLAMLLASVALAWHPFYRMCVALQFSYYALAHLGAQPAVWVRLPRLVRLGLMFYSMNLALLVGLWRWLSGAHSGVWQRTEREGGARAGHPSADGSGR